jgi:ABC-2 type transport system ATP-binding protein
MICGVMEPSRGKVLTRGRIAGLLEVGAGFHPELTGRENIYLNGSILGMSKTEIERTFDSIVDFSELGHLIDGQVRNYSSGMHSRLAFSVAVHTDCDIFVLDETLAVGDAPFKRKCMRKIMELKNQGLTMFYVGHGRGAVLKLCELGIVLQAGQMAFFGSAKDAVKVLDSGGEEDEMLEAAEEVMA